MRRCPICGSYNIGDRVSTAKHCFQCVSLILKFANKAHGIVSQAIKSGALPHPKTLTCVVCDEPAQVYDHRDYEQPLKVKPVCRRCNHRLGSAFQFKPGSVRHVDLSK